jgi:ATP-binding cassette subfamily F protein 3
LLGANGAGKSTLLRTLAGAQDVLQGIVTPGEHLRIGYFTQHQIETLDDKASAALHILRISPKATEQQIRDFLGSFNFRGDRALEPIEPFSGGEKARLALALICWQKPNLLLLDEPTNHLDLDMCEALTEALQDFEGAIVLVSHDRHLVRNTADELLLVHDGKVDEFDGDLDDYSRWLINTLREQRNTAKPAQDKKDKASSKNSQASVEIKELKKELSAIETRMSKLQQQLQAIEDQLGDSSIYEPKNKERLQKLTQEQKQCHKQLAADEERWLAVQEQIEAA